MGNKPPKNTGSKRRPQEEEKEEVLQAVVISDTFETKFAPFTLERPRCLLPLVNVPIIEYTLDFLARSGVQEVFLSAGSLTEQVEKYLETSKWTQDSSPFQKIVFLKSAAMSVGDVMRDVDQKGLVTGDFLVVSGDVVSNFPLVEVMAQHKARRHRDKNAIMTMLLKEAGTTQPISERLQSPVFVIDPTTERCLHYEEPLSREHSHFAMDPGILKHPEIDMRQDLIDCRIDICCPDVLSLWSDNFDNQLLRKDFLHGILKDYELNGKTIHTHIFNNHFARRVVDLPTYDRLSREMCHRWSFPEGPPVGHRYQKSRAGFYQEQGTRIARSATIGFGTIVGEGTTIGSQSTVQHGVIGRRCWIGRNAKIRHAYIWDGTVIEDNADIIRSIVAEGVVVGQGSHIRDGSLVSFGVRIDQGRTVESSRVTRVGLDGVTQDKNDTDLVGENGLGHLFIGDEEDGDTDRLAQRNINGLGRVVLSGKVECTLTAKLVYQESAFASSTSSISSTDTDQSPPTSPQKDSRSGSFTTVVSDDDGTDRFHHEAVTSLFERMKQSTRQDDVQVELMGLRFANNASGSQVRKAVATAFTKYLSFLITRDKLAISDAVQNSLQQYRRLIQREEAQEGESAQAEFLLEAQRDLAHRPDGSQILLHFVMNLYNQDMFDEDTLIKWWHDDRSQATDDLRNTRQPVAQFMDWLANAEEESDSASSGPGSE